MSRREYLTKPEFQWIGPRRLLCLLCARVISTNGRTRIAHERGIEHRVAKEEAMAKATELR